MNRRAAAAPPPDRAASPWSPFRYPPFAVLWVAAVVSNIGTWMYSAASGWLMASLSPDPLIVSLVQVATSLPMFLFALPGGALADIVDRRRLLLVVEIAVTVLSAVFAALVWLDLVTPITLLAFMFLIGAGSAISAPPWQSIVPQLVPRPVLHAAVAANSVGFNISRAVGPALGGVIAAGLGIALPFCLNAVSNLGVIGALLWWRAPRTGSRHLPAERFGNAIRVGVRHAVSNPHLSAALMRAVGFFLFASAYWALLPLVAHAQMKGGPALYGILLGAIGAGAVVGAFALPRLKAWLGPDRLVAAGTLGTAIALALFGTARDAGPALAASLVAGASWIAVLSTLNVATQIALPEWVRGRGLAILVTVLFGSMAVGSLLWGKLAASVGLPIAHYVAAAGLLLAIPLTRRWRLQGSAEIDLTPSMHWPQPVLTHEVQSDKGPVLVTVEYRIDPRNRDAFLAALERLSHERGRDGAYAWGIFEDAAEAGRFLETFFLESWLEHLRQHERITNADRVLQATVHGFHVSGTPTVTHFIAAGPITG